MADEISAEALAKAIYEVHGYELRDGISWEELDHEWNRKTKESHVLNAMSILARLEPPAPEFKAGDEVFWCEGKHRNACEVAEVLDDGRIRVTRQGKNSLWEHTVTPSELEKR